eukprot:gene41401-50517_t
MQLDDENSVLIRAIQQDDFIAVESLLNGNLELLNSRSSIKNQSILHLAVSNASLQVVKYLCQSQQHDVTFINDQKSWGETALHVAVGMGDAALVRALIAVPTIDQSIEDSWKRTPVDLAIEMGHAHLISDGLLDSKFISPKDQTNDSNVAHVPEELQRKQHALAGELSQTLNTRKSKQSLISASVIKVRGMFQDSQETVTGITVSSIKAKNESSTLTPSSNEPPASLTGGVLSKNNNKPLKTALSKLIEFPGDPDVIRSALLHKDTIDINGKDMFGLTALHKLAAWNKVDLINLLLDDPDLDINVVSSPIGSVLHSAVDMGAVEAVERLLTLPNLDLALLNKQGRTALDFAREKGLEKAVKLIEERVSFAMCDCKQI